MMTISTVLGVNTGMGVLTRRRVRWGGILGLDRQRLSAWRRSGLTVLLLLGLGLNLVIKQEADSLHHGDSPLHYSIGGSVSSRHLLEVTNGSESSGHGPVWERCTFEQANYPAAWIFNHTVFIIVIFIALAIVCDDFFVPSLEAISEKLQLSEDVAGATFMAAGSSAPELFTSVAGVAVETDVGVGTIVGSAVFNILIIIALTAALAGKVLNLDWRPLIRDSFFYAMSIACFIGFSWDGFFVHYEAAVLLTLYILYIILMAFNPRLMDWMGTWRCLCVTTVLPVDEENAATTPDSPEHHAADKTTAVSQARMKDGANVNGTKPRSNSYLLLEPPKYPGALNHARRVSLISQKSVEEKHIFHHHQRGSIVGALGHHPTIHKKSLTPEEPISEEQPKEDPATSTVDEEDEEEDDETMQICPCLPCCPAIRTTPPSSEEAWQKGGCWNWMKLILRWLIFIPAFPFFILFSWTIPDCSKEHNKKWFIVSFLMSVLWIAALSFGMVTLVSRVGCILGIDTYTMGLVIIAMGTSIPDAMSSVLVARDGYGDMAVSNAIGSNVFDINLGLGLPFIIRIAIDKGRPITLLSSAEWLDYHSGKMPIIPHAKFGFILLIILVITLFLFTVIRFRLNKAIGITFVSMYIIFLIYAFIQELYCVRQLNTYC